MPPSLTRSCTNRRRGAAACLRHPRAELGFVDQPHSVGVEVSREGLSVAMVLMCPCRALDQRPTTAS